MIQALLPIQDAGRFLGYTGKTSGKTSVYQHCKEGRLSKVKIGGRSFVTRASAEDLIQRSTINSLEQAALPEPTIIGVTGVGSD